MHFTTLNYKTLKEHHEDMADMLCKYDLRYSEYG